MTRYTDEWLDAKRANIQRWKAQEAARSAALVNTMSTPLRPAPTNEHLRAPTRSTAPGAVSRTNANRDQPTPTLTVPHNPKVAGSNPAPATR